MTQMRTHAAQDAEDQADLKPPKKVSVYNYLDYRLFLRDKFQEMKDRNRHFSYRLFNRLAGIRSSAHLKLVVDGKRNVGEDLARKMTHGFRLNEEETLFFQNLVKFNQSTTYEAKNRFFCELSKYKKFTDVKHLESAHYHLYSNWHYLVILEMLTLDTQAPKTIHWIHKHLKSPVAIRAIREAIQELKRLDLITEKEDGTFEKKETLLTALSSVASLAMINFYIRMSEMAMRAVQEQRPEDREFAALTVALSQEGFQNAKKEIQKFKKKIHSLMEKSIHQPKCVVAHINLQLFKLSDIAII